MSETESNSLTEDRLISQREVVQILEDAASYMRSTKGYWDRDDSARSYAAIAKKVAMMESPK
jgi:hypothetical protein